MKVQIIFLIILIIISIETGTLEVAFHNTNELISSLSAYIQTICIVLQSFLIYKQFQLSKEIEEKARAEQKGIFILDITNIGNEFISELQTNNKYDLRKPLSFHNKGNDHVILNKTIINKKIIETSTDGTFFTNQSDYSKLLIDLKLTEEDLNKEKIDITIELEMENLKGYIYQELIKIGFIREDKNSSDIYNLDHLNIKIK